MVQPYTHCLVYLQRVVLDSWKVRIHELQQLLEDMQYLVIDEMSMVRRKTFG